MYEAHRFDLRFLRRFRADLSIRKSSSFLPPLIAATSQRGVAPRPAQVSPDGPRYFGGTFLPFNVLRRRTRCFPSAGAVPIVSPHRHGRGALTAPTRRSATTTPPYDQSQADRV